MLSPDYLLACLECCTQEGLGFSNVLNYVEVNDWQKCQVP